MALYHGDIKISGRGDKGADGAGGGVSAIDIASGTDLNTLTAVGFYKCQTYATSQTLTNCPVAAAFSLLVEYANGPMQTLTIYAAAPAVKVYRRVANYLGVWQAWQCDSPSYGTAVPSGGLDGDIYFRYV